MTEYTTNSRDCSHQPPRRINLLLRALALAVLLQCALTGAALAFPLGTIGGPADSLIRVQSVSGMCSNPVGPMCAEAVGLLPTMDYSLEPTAHIVASGLVNHLTGTLDGDVVFFPDSNGQQSTGELTVNARDVFTVAGPGTGQTLAITARLRVQGTIIFEGDPALKSATVEGLLSRAPNGWDSTNGGLVVSTGASAIFRSGINPAADIFDIDIEAVDTFAVTIGDPFQLAYRMDLQGGVNGNSGQRSVDFNFDDGAVLSFDLASGYSITSELGYDGTVVPVPASVLLLGPALAVLIRTTRRA